MRNSGSSNSNSNSNSGGNSNSNSRTTTTIGASVLLLLVAVLQLPGGAASFAITATATNSNGNSSKHPSRTAVALGAVSSPPPPPPSPEDPTATATTTTPTAGVIGGSGDRRAALARIAAAPLLAATTATAAVAAEGSDDSNSNSEKKQTNLSDEDMISIVVDRDLVANQFLVNGRLTRSIYDESCTFRDEIDTYGLEQWMRGTAKLFDGDRSRVVLVPGSVKKSGNNGNGNNGNNNNNNNDLEFRFVEYLCFNVPVVKPIVYLSGTLFLTRSETTGLITSYREKWDQDIYKVLTSESKLFTAGIPKESLDADLETFFAANANANANNSQA